MQVVKIECPCCGATLKRKRFSNKYVCSYCDNEFEVNNNNPVPARKNEVKSGYAQPVYAAISVIVLSIMIVGFVLYCISRSDESDSNQNAGPYYSYYDDTDDDEDVEFYALPESDRGKQIASLIFGKPFDEVTEDDMLKVRYLSFDSDFDSNTFKDIDIIYYSFEDYKDYDNWSNFEDTIQSVTYSEDNEEGDFSDMDYACFKNLTYLDTYYIDENVLMGLSNLTGFHIGGIDMDEMAKYCDLSKIDEFEIDYSEDEEASLAQVLPDMTNLRKLVIDCYEMTIVPDTVKSLTGLRSLELYNADNIKDYSFLENFTNLEELNIRNGDDFKDLGVVKNMPELKSLTLENTGVKDYEDLRDNKNIEKLVINYNDNVKDISPLSTLSNLQEFETTIYTMDMAPLSSLKKIKRLTLSTNGTISLDFVSGMTDLEQLDLICCNTSDDISYLYGLKKLKKLVISSPDSSLDFNNLMNIPSLEEVYITGSESDSVWLKNLLQMKTLKTLSIKNVDLHTDFGLDLSQSGLETLILDNVKLYQVDAWDEADFSNITKMLKTSKKIKNLELQGVGLEDLTDISKITTLEKLDISDNYVKDYTILGSLKNLQSIKIGGNISNVLTDLAGLDVYTDDGHICRP